MEAISGLREKFGGSSLFGNENVPAFDKTIKMKVYYLKDQGSYAVWKATKANGQYDLKTFEVKARPVEKMEGLRPGMSLIIKD